MRRLSAKLYQTSGSDQLSLSVYWMLVQMQPVKQQARSALSVQYYGAVGHPWEGLVGCPSDLTTVEVHAVVDHPSVITTCRTLFAWLLL